MIKLHEYKFSIEHYGEATCMPNHSFGPGIKRSYLITIILDGTGKFTIDNVTRDLHANDVFLVPPNVLHHYQADENNPWHYAWISFDVDDFEEDFYKISAKQHTRHIRNPEMILHYISMIKRSELLRNSTYEVLRDDAIIKLFLSELLTENSDIVESPKELRVQAVKDFIQMNYFQPITIQEIADKFKYNRSYLCRMFKDVEGKSPKQYMIDLKMQIASNLLLESDISVENVSNSVGYHDSFTFSKMFKKRMGVSPNDYRNYIIKTLKEHFSINK